MDGFHPKYDSSRKPQIYFSQVMCDGMYASVREMSDFKKMINELIKYSEKQGRYNFILEWKCTVFCNFAFCSKKTGVKTLYILLCWPVVLFWLNILCNQWLMYSLLIYSTKYSS